MMLGFLRRAGMVTVLALATVWSAAPATAQPAAPPGTICILDAGGWCWATTRGTPGDACRCPTPRGRLPGTLR